MDEETPPVGTPPPVIRGPLAPRWAVTLVTLTLVGTIVYSSTREDYRSMIVEAVVLLFILGADIGAMIRGWHGGGP